MLLKESTIILVRKTKIYSCLNDYRPVALISVVMKTFESFIVTYLKLLLSANFNPFQVAG